MTIMRCSSMHSAKGCNVLMSAMAAGEVPVYLLHVLHLTSRHDQQSCDQVGSRRPFPCLLLVKLAPDHGPSRSQQLRCSAGASALTLGAQVQLVRHTVTLQCNQLQAPRFLERRRQLQLLPLPSTLLAHSLVQC